MKRQSISEAAEENKQEQLSSKEQRYRKLLKTTYFCLRSILSVLATGPNLLLEALELSLATVGEAVMQHCHLFYSLLGHTK